MANDTIETHYDIVKMVQMYADMHHALLKARIDDNLLRTMVVDYLISQHCCYQF